MSSCSGSKWSSKEVFSDGPGLIFKCRMASQVQPRLAWNIPTCTKCCQVRHKQQNIHLFSDYDWVLLAKTIFSVGNSRVSISLSLASTKMSMRRVLPAWILTCHSGRSNSRMCTCRINIKFSGSTVLLCKMMCKPSVEARKILIRQCEEYVW